MAVNKLNGPPLGEMFQDGWEHAFPLSLQAE